jgi:hypothetical protein
MLNFTSSPEGAFATSAAVVSVGLALFVPYGHPWASLAWAVLACAAARWSTSASRGAVTAPVQQERFGPEPRASRPGVAIGENA